MNTPYESIQSLLQPGDVIAFGGDDLKSRAISVATRSAVSHVAVVVRTYRDRYNGPKGLSHLLVESTWLPGEHPGVNAHWLDERLATYRGAMWWLPLSQHVRTDFNETNFQGFMLSQLVMPFDFVQSLQSAIDVTDSMPALRRMSYAREDLDQFFCSELVAAGLRAGGVLRHINCSEITPADVCQFAIYDGDYHQLKGRQRRIPGYNSLNPEHWGYNVQQKLAYGFSGN